MILLSKELLELEDEKVEGFELQQILDDLKAFKSTIDMSRATESSEKAQKMFDLFSQQINELIDQLETKMLKNAESQELTADIWSMKLKLKNIQKQRLKAKETDQQLYYKTMATESKAKLEQWLVGLVKNPAKSGVKVLDDILKNWFGPNI